ncbi:hypothetical protein [Streptomyces sp. NBC_01500]|uniref:hypothetical protein n=1 Tax=Streptomyces sp. NBC_01500 TaxID=2903886 RepID=UPI002B1CC6CC|nr:hypothetical protein [Streptomyces sp. NBC_01500]
MSPESIRWSLTGSLKDIAGIGTGPIGLHYVNHAGFRPSGWRRPDNVFPFPGQLNWLLGGAAEVAESYEQAAARRLPSTGKRPPRTASWATRGSTQ